MRIGLSLKKTAKKKKAAPTLAPSYDMVVHFGAPKTGSSAIQYFLLHNRDRLEQCGFYYPPHPHDRNAVSGGHSKLSVALLDKNRFGDAEAILHKYLDEARAKGLILLLSAESLCMQPDRFKQLVGGLAVRAIGFYRDPLESLFSAYNQNVKRSFLTVSLIDYCRNLLRDKPVPSLEGSMHLKWADTFGDDHVKILPYDMELFKSESIERRFLKAIGLDEHKIESFTFLDKQVNGSYVPSALALKRLLNLVLDKDQSTYNKEIDHCLQQYSDSNPEARLTLAQLLPEEIYGRLVARFQASIDMVRARFFQHQPHGFLERATHVEMSDAPFPSSGAHTSAYVANQAFKGKEDVIRYLKERITQYCLDARMLGPDHFELAKLIGLDLPPPTATTAAKGPMLSAEQLERIMAPKAGAPTVLRELAVAHEKAGQLDVAMLLIQRACDLRPEAPPLLRTRDRIQGRMAK